ncbi:hypothetical protein ABE096_14210 [Robertmurraya massiliosenegalensis]|uniref:hypothetical protein n=1 Tax=Robertmurraya TaxID=2837507 RepID=UPI0039A5C031
MSDLKFMDILQYLTKIYENGINGPIEFVVVFTLFFISAAFIISKLINIISLSNFDRFFIPKNKKTLQALILKVGEYLLIPTAYLAFGIPILFISLTIPNIVQFILISLLVVFTSSLFILLLNYIFKDSAFLWLFNKMYQLIKWLLTKMQLNNILKELIENRFIQKFKRCLKFIFVAKILEINFFSGIFLFGGVWAILFQMTPEYHAINYKYYIALFFFPAILTALYRQYSEKKSTEISYVCEDISKNEFNDSNPFIRYSLDQDRIIYSEKDPDDYKIYYVYDRSTDKYMRFTKKGNEVSTTNN